MYYFMLSLNVKCEMTHNLHPSLLHTTHIPSPFPPSTQNKVNKYRNLGLVFTLTKKIIIHFQKINSFL